MKAKDKIKYEEISEYFLNKNPYFNLKFKDVILIDNNEYIKNDILKFKEEFELRNTISDYNLALTRSLLFSGEAGLGKTLLAKALSGELNLPLYILDIGELLQDNRGLEKINKIFDFVSDLDNQPCILFLDECDSITKSRANPNVDEATKRITNKIMQWLNEENESKDSNLIVIAATNYASGIDAAFKTRFQMNEIFYLPTDYIPYIKLEVAKNDMFELYEDTDPEDIKNMNINLRETKLSIRELNASINIVFKQEIIKRAKKKALDGTKISIRLSDILIQLGKLKNFNPIIKPLDKQSEDLPLDEVLAKL